MKTFQFLCLLLLINTQTNAQNRDFKLIKDSLVTFSSGGNDSLSLVRTRLRLEALDTNSISKNIQLYYRELGRCYYRLYLNSKDTLFLTMAINSYEKALFHKQDYSTVLWDISLCHYILGHCKIGGMYLIRYKNVTPKKSRSKIKTDLISGNCKPIKRNTLFFELLGNGFFYSINYDRLFDINNKIKISTRIGFGYINNFNGTELRNIYFPLEVSGLYPIYKNRHFFEVGTGLTFWNILNHYSLRSEEDIIIALRIGYRIQKPNGGLFFKIGFTPLYPIIVINPDPGTIYNVWALFGGIATGYTF